MQVLMCTLWPNVPQIVNSGASSATQNVNQNNQIENKLLIKHIKKENA